MLNLGVFDAGDTVYVPFTISDGAGGRVDSSSAFAQDDFSVYKDGSLLTLGASTITVTENPSTTSGSTSGVYHIAIDMSNDTDFTNGSQYWVVLHPASKTIDGQAPAAFLGYWQTAYSLTLSGTIATGTNSTTTDLGVPGTDCPNVDISGWWLWSPDDNEIVVITSYATGTGVATHTATSDAAALTTNSPWILIPQAKALLDWINGERLDAILDSIVADTNELQTDWANGGRLDLILDAASLTSALTESYSTDGSTATAAELLYMIYALLGEFSVSGTTLTVKKLDGSTTAGTFTLDSGTAPTSITRAT